MRDEHSLRIHGAILIAIVLLFFAQLDMSYRARLHTDLAVHRTSIAACLRSVHDRYANAEAWYADYRHELVQLQHETGAQKRADEYVAAAYLRSAKILASHSTRPVSWPVGSHHYPLGHGQLNCYKVFPLPQENFFQF